MIKCEICGETREIERHHVQTTLTGDVGSYNKTKEIIFVCKEHHYILHRKKLHNPKKRQKIETLSKCLIHS